MKLDKNLRRALILRLRFFLADEERGYEHWKERVRPRMKKTRADRMDRMQRQRIQAFKMVIWILTPSMEREGDFPGYWNNN